MVCFVDRAHAAKAEPDSTNTSVSFDLAQRTLTHTHTRIHLSVPLTTELCRIDITHRKVLACLRLSRSHNSKRKNAFRVCPRALFVDPITMQIFRMCVIVCVIDTPKPEVASVAKPSRTPRKRGAAQAASSIISVSCGMRP